MTYPQYPGAEPQSPRPSAWRALVRVISEPAATFQAFEGRVPIFPPYLLEMLFGLAGVLMSMPAVLRLLEQTYATTPGLTPQAATAAKWSAIGVSLFMALAGPWLAGLLVSLFAMFYGQFQEERVSFGPYLGMVGYARVPLALAGLLAGALNLALGDRVKEFSLSLAALAPVGAGPVVKQLLGLGSPFGIWYYILLAIGFGALHRSKASKGAALALTVFLILALLGTGFAALGAKLSPQM